MATKRPLCKYASKCYRKDPNHWTKFEHPEKMSKKNGKGMEDEEPPAKKVKIASDETTDDVEMKPDISKGAIPETTVPKTKLKRRKTHEMSNSEEEEDSGPSPAKKKMVTTATNTDETISLDATTTSATGGKKRPRCRYWEKCYRKEKNHLKTYAHPGDTDAADPNVLDYGDDDGSRLTRGKKRSLIKPLHDFADGDTHEIKGKGDFSYKLKRTGDHYYCTCLGWRNQNKATDKRTCKHLKEYLGEEFENTRCGISSTSYSLSADSNTSTINRRPRHKTIKQLLLAHKWNSETHDPKGWWMSEKLDGVRAYWDGSAFYSRLGNEFIPPAWFTKDLPSEMELDGELFGGRGKFQSTVSIVKTPGCDGWKNITYEVFDVPSLGKQPFEKRIQEAKEYFEKHNVKHVHVLKQEKCKGAEHIEEELQRVEGLGGEGLMIREPGSKYVNGRSNTLLKIKSFYDAEAKVIGYIPGKGNNHGKTGSLRCVMACGKEFSVGSGMTDKDRARPPKKGSIISYKFQELTNSGSPRFPIYIGVRIDMTEPKDAVLPAKKQDA